ncbi:MAG: 2-oxoacid:acceptor oxidoreductase family protein [Desulfobacteraceae bacterium]
MKQQIVISGVGGQGVLLITGILAGTFMEKGFPVLTSETHGMAQRGGTVISHFKTGDFQSPLVRPGCADILVAFTLDNFHQHRSFVRQGGICFVNMPEGEPVEKGVSAVDADRLANLDNSPSVNLYMLGALVAGSGLCGYDEVCARIEQRFQGKSPEVIRSALDAFRTGYEYRRERA